MREIPITEVVNLITAKMANGGVFLCVANGETKNVMTIGWGGVNTFFGAPCFLAPVRQSRYSYGIIRKNGAFTVGVPLHDMRKQLAFAGSESGRDVDKFVGHGITAASAQAVNVPIVKECELQLECEPQGYVEQKADMMIPEIRDRVYADGDMHTFFLGKIVRCYYTE
ncbi:MAG: flavin reductase family protein [Eubacteriales bacterium]|nr:flavin reductase family protein [Eubacteriales bacterium]